MSSLLRFLTGFCLALGLGGVGFVASAVLLPAPFSESVQTDDGADPTDAAVSDMAEDTSSAEGEDTKPPPGVLIINRPRPIIPSTGQDGQ